MAGGAIAGAPGSLTGCTAPDSLYEGHGGRRIHVLALASLVSANWQKLGQPLVESFRFQLGISFQDLSQYSSRGDDTDRLFGHADPFGPELVVHAARGISPSADIGVQEACWGSM